MKESIAEGVRNMQAMAVEHSNALWDALANANPETPAEANMLLGAYMGALTEHVGQRAQEAEVSTSDGATDDSSA